MGKDSEIAWTDDTFNPWWGCKEIEAECANCYAYAWANRMGFGDTWDKPTQASIRRIMSDNYWKEPYSWNRHAQKEGRRRRVFCGSMCDWLDEHPVVEPERQKLFKVIEATPWLDWLMLSKRIENFAFLIPQTWVGGGLPKNMWVGITAGQQSTWDKQWPVLDTLKWIYKRIAFVSVEPMIGPLDIRKYLVPHKTGPAHAIRPIQVPDWIIIGGESNQPGGIPTREMKAEWVFDLIIQIRDSGLPIKIFMKQLGSVLARKLGIADQDPTGSNIDLWPTELRIREVPDVPILY